MTNTKQSIEFKFLLKTIFSISILGIFASPLLAYSSSVDLNIEYRVIIQLSPNANSSATTKIAAKLLGAEFRLADFTQNLSVDNKKYSLTYAIDMPRAISLVSSLDKIKRESSGLVLGGSLIGYEIVEQRGTKSDVFRASYDAKRKNVSFYKNKNKTGEAALDGVITDINSLKYFWLGKSPNLSKHVINVMDSKKIYRSEFASTRNVFNVGKESIPVIVHKKINRNKDDAELTVVVRVSDGFPVRVDFGLSEKEGVKMSIYPLSLPKELVKLN